MSEFPENFAISPGALQEFYKIKLQEQQHRDNDYFAVEFPDELMYLENGEKLEETLTRQITESINLVSILPFQQISKERMTAILLRCGNIINNISEATGLQSKIVTSDNSIKFLNSFYDLIPATNDQMKLRSDVMSLIILFKKIRQYFQNNLPL